MFWPNHCPLVVNPESNARLADGAQIAPRVTVPVTCDRSSIRYCDSALPAVVPGSQPSKSKAERRSPLPTHRSSSRQEESRGHYRQIRPGHLLAPTQQSRDLYADLGSDHYDRHRNPARAQRTTCTHARHLRHRVTLEPAFG